MSDFALIARADRGGIAAQSWELFRHLSPRRVLIVDLGNRGRGQSDPTMYGTAAELRITSGVPDADDAAWLVRSGVRSLFTIEGLYSEPMRLALVSTGLRTVLQANPELYRPDDLRHLNLEVVLPTPWEAHRFPEGTRVLPVPANTTDLAPARPTPTRPSELVVFHPAGVAMADRNGTRIVLAALRHVTENIRIRVANRPDLPRRLMNRVRMDPVPDVPRYLDHWQARVDLLVLPRRYGGLCLPMQEAAALGVPIITTGLEPQRSWVPEQGLVPVAPHPVKVAMKGGTFDVFACGTRELAQKIDRFVNDPGLRLEAGIRVREHAESISWGRLTPTYQELLA